MIKTFIMLQNISISDKCFLFIKETWRKKIYSAVFIIHNNNNNNNNKCILSSKSEYLNDFWTSCDWSNDAENSALITGINYILKYILNIKNISQYYCFCCILDQTNTGLVNRRDLFKKIIKKSYCSKTLNGSVYHIYIQYIYIYIYIYYMVVVGRLDQKMPGPIFCPSPALNVSICNSLLHTTALKSLLIKNQCCHISNTSTELRSFVLEFYYWLCTCLFL